MGAKEILAIHPAPWHPRQGLTGVITMVDNAGQVVELLTMLEFVSGVTASIASANTATKTPETTAS